MQEGTSANLNFPLLSAGADAFPLAAGMTVFCDFDGPIIDVSERYYSTYQQGLADTEAAYKKQGVCLHLQTLTQEQFWQMKQARLPDVEIAMRSGLQGEQVEVFVRRVSQIVNGPNLLDKDRLQPGVQWALALLHSQGVRLVLVTLRRQTQATQILENYGLARLFSRIQGTLDDESAYHNYSDVKKQLLAEVIEQQNVLPASAWMIGDTEADILAGQALDIPTIALTCGLRSRFYLQQFQPTRITADLLSAAHYLLGCTQPVAVQTI